MVTFHKDRTISLDRIFVFGSNLAGIHGAGAAQIARLRYGAELGIGMGLTGKSYAIPTKDEHLNPLSLKEIQSHVANFIHYTKTHPDLKFFVTRVGCGLAGNKDSEIAPLFKYAENCSFAEEWQPYITD